MAEALSVSCGGNPEQRERSEPFSQFSLQQLQADSITIMPDTSDEFFIKLALQEALNAYDQTEVPVGAVVVHQGRVIGRGYNLRESLNDPTAHAEIIALTAAAEAIGDWRLEDCELFVTLEPCPMCAGALVNARIKRVVFGAYDPKAGCCGTLMNLVQEPRFNHRCDVRGGVMEDDCADLLRMFFRERRKKPKGSPEA